MTNYDTVRYSTANSTERPFTKANNTLWCRLAMNWCSERIESTTLSRHFDSVAIATPMEHFDEVEPPEERRITDGSCDGIVLELDVRTAGVVRRCTQLVLDNNILVQEAQHLAHERELLRLRVTDFA